MTVIIDAMGGDNAPKEIVKGAILAAQAGICDVLLVGDEVVITPMLSEYKGGKIRVVHAADTVDMDDKASLAVRQKRDSSMSIALRLLAEGQGQALVSAGNTGALLTGATLVAKRIKGVRRAALTTTIPVKGGKMLLLDCGANVDCTPEFLLQFACMGHFYMSSVCAVKSPRVALLNNGTEDTKGDQLRKDTFELLKQAHAKGIINFIGHLEGREAMLGAADVLVCDGFTGNIFLKTVEGCAMFMMSELKDIFTKSLFTKMCAGGLAGGLRSMKNKMDYKETGGAPMLGVSKPVIKAHGSSNARAIYNAVCRAVEFEQAGVISEIEKSIELMTVKKDGADH